MPIFASRSVRRMLDALAPSLSVHRVRDLEARIRAQNDQTVPAEWEIAVGFALSRVGKIIDLGNHRPGNPDYIFVPRDASNEIVVEVTSLSDKTLDEKNPVDDFLAELRRVSVKEGVSPKLGAISWNFGDAEVNGQIFLGIPERRDFDAFFKTTGFRSFLQAIKTSPGKTHSYRFGVRGITSVLSFSPGQVISSGGYRSYKVARKLDDTGIYNQLRRKEKQISKSALDLPALVFLCDNDSHHLSHSKLNSHGTFKIDDIVSVFLDGRPHRQAGPLILQQGMEKRGKRIHAVVTLTVHWPWAIFSGLGRKELRGSIIYASHCDEFVCSAAVRRTIDAAIGHLPPPVETPRNAMRQYRWPAGFGGGQMSANEVKISLLTLQKMLVGEITYDEFSREHGMLADRLRNLNAQGLMISRVGIEHQKDFDDDWISMQFDGIQPSRLFDSDKG